MAQRLQESFFAQDARKVAKDLLGKVIVRKIEGEILKAKIVETEAYFDENDPGSWARLGKRNDNSSMWDEPGTILIKNVHMYKMLNFVTGRKNEPQAVLIRAVEPINFKGRCNGPGLLTESLGISKNFNRKLILGIGDFWLEDSKENPEIVESFRVGLKKDLDKKMRFYIKDNLFVSRK